MKRIALTLSAATLLSLLPCSAKVTMLPFRQPLKSYAAYCNEAFDMSLSMPKGFSDVSKFGIYSPNSPKGKTLRAHISGAIAKSNDGNCVVFYSYLPLQYEVGTASQRASDEAYWAEKGTAYWSNEPSTLAVADYVTQLPATKFNADTAIAVSLDANAELFEGKRYTNNTYIILKKSGRRFFTISALFTDDGLKDKQRYLNAIFDSVKFGNKPGWTFNRETEQAAHAKHLVQFNAYAKKHNKVTGLTPTAR